MLEPAARELVHERTQTEVGVERCHGVIAVAADLVLLHGFTQTGSSWDPVRAALGERYSAFAPDLPGHGVAAHRRPVTLAAAIAYLRALPTAAFVLAGYSLGGRVALHAALALGPRVGRLVLVSATAGIADPAAREQRRLADEALANRIESIGIAAFAREWAEQPVFAGESPHVAAQAHAQRLRQTPAGLAAALRGLGQGACPPVWERLGELRMPVRLVVGERDVRYRELAAGMLARIPHAELTVVPGAGHAAHLEAPDIVAAAL